MPTNVDFKNSRHDEFILKFTKSFSVLFFFTFNVKLYISNTVLFNKRF